MEQPRSAFVSANAIQLHYLAWDPQQASDEIPLVLLHGLAATADTWRLVASPLSQCHPVVAFDLRGHGLSEQPPGGYEALSVGEDIVQGMATLGLGQVALVGHAWGARIALTLAARHPALVSHLVLIEGAYDEPRYWPGMTRERFLRQPVVRESYPSREAFLEAMRAELAGFWSPEVAQIVSTYGKEQPDGQVRTLLRPEIQRIIKQAQWDERLLNYYRRVTCPVLLIPAALQPQPGMDLPARLESSEDFAAAKGLMALEFARALHRCAILWLPEAAHDIHLQSPERIANAIIHFVKESQ